MTRRRTYLFLCRLLSQDDSNAGRKRLSGLVDGARVDWERVVEISSRHLITPALLTALTSKI